MEVSGCNLGDQGWIPGMGTGFLFVSLHIPFVGLSYPSHRLVFGIRSCLTWIRAFGV